MCLEKNQIIMDWIDELNNSKWFSHNLNDVDYNISRFVLGSGCTILYYIYEDYGEIFTCINKKTDYIFYVSIRDIRYSNNNNNNKDDILTNEPLPYRFEPFSILIERMDNPNPSKKLLRFNRIKKLKKILK